MNGKKKRLKGGQAGWTEKRGKVKRKWRKNVGVAAAKMGVAAAAPLGGKYI